MMKRIALLVALLVLLVICTGCGNDDSFRRTLESGQAKYRSGQPMTKQEYNAVKGFNDWKANQSGKTYDQWGR